MSDVDEYPPSIIPSAEFEDPDYQDEAAVVLYKEAGGGKLVGALSKLHKALDAQAAKLEEFYNTPYSEDHAKTIAVTMDAIEKVELQLERWHALIYPNQGKGDA